jgi:hypothetical protein
VITDTVIHLNSPDGAVDGLAFTSSDLLTYDTAAGAWSFYFDGSSVGVTQTVDAFFLESDGSLLLSLGSEQTLPGLETVDDADIVRFTPTSLGVTTSGVFTMVLDGSDVGLNNINEDIDAISRAPDGRLLVSVSGSFSADVTGGDEDLFVFNAAQLGDTTAGSWDMYFDGSDVGLGTGTTEDIDGVWIDPATGYLYLGTTGDFVAGVGFGGDKNDIFVCAPTSLGSETNCALALFWDGGAYGLIDGNLRGFSLLPAEGMAGAGAEPAMLDSEPLEESSQNDSMYLPHIPSAHAP